MIEITSFSNTKYKYFKSLGKSRNRKKEGVFLMEGREELDMAHIRSIVPETVLFCESYISPVEIQERYGEQIDKVKLSKPLFDELTYQNVPGNYLGLFRVWHSPIESMEVDTRTVILEAVEKPGNLGAILRTCEAAGIANVVVTESQIDLFNPNVIRNSRGAFLNVKTAFTSNEAAKAWCVAEGLAVYATSLDKEAIDFRDVDRGRSVVFVFGGEAQGISDFWKTNAQLITIPMQGTVDSLNLSVSVGIVLFN
jgi:TrmH family RNA methyltransferase